MSGSKGTMRAGAPGFTGAGECRGRAGGKEEMMRSRVPVGGRGTATSSRPGPEARSPRRGFRLFQRAGVLVCAALLAGTSVRAESPPLDYSKPYGAEDLVRIALARNLTLAQSEQNVRTSAGRQLQARSAMLPNVQGNLNYNQSTSASSGQRVIGGYLIPGQAGTQVSDTYNLSASLNQNLVDLPSIYSVRQAGRALESARLGYTDARRTLALSVRQQYYTVVQAQEQATVAQDAYTLAQEQLRRAQSLFELGSVARSDVLQAQVNLASAERDRISTMNAIDQERARLNLLLALPVDAPVRIAEPGQAPDSVATPPESELIRRAEASRPDLRRARADVAAADAGVSSAEWSRYPTLAGQLSYSNRRFGPVFSPISSDPLDVFQNLKTDANWGFSVGLSVPVFDGLRTKGSIQMARAGRIQSREAVEQTRLQVALDVRVAMIQIKNAGEEIRSARQGVAFAEESVRLQKALYESGGGTLLEWNNAQVQLTRARLAQVQAEMNMRLAQAALDNAIGAEVL